MYAFVHQGKVFGPDGIIKDVEGTPLEAKDAEAYNKALEAQEIERIKSGPDKLFVYIGHKPMDSGDPHKTYGWGKDHHCVQTWTGAFLGWAWIGPKRKFPAFGNHSIRRAVTVRIFGVLYHGWYFESSGDYCRLTKAKRQDMRYGATLYVA